VSPKVLAVAGGLWLTSCPWGEHMADAQIRRKLRIGRLNDALAFPFQNSLPLLRLGLIPGLAVIVFNVAAFSLLPRYASAVISLEDARRAAENYQLFYWLWMGVWFFAIAVFFVGVCRLILRGERPGWLPRFRRYELAFLTALALLALLGALYGMAGYAVLSPLDAYLEQQPDPASAMLLAAALVEFAVWLLMIFLYVRLALLLPHATATGVISPAVSWRGTRGNFWRFVLAFLLLLLIAAALWMGLGLVSMVAVAMVEGVLGVLAPGGGVLRGAPLLGTMAIWMLILAPMIGIILAMVMAFLAYAYKDLVQDAAVAE
jgi:hypothetical protein